MPFSSGNASTAGSRNPVNIRFIARTRTRLAFRSTPTQEHSLLVAMLDQLKASRPTIFVELLDTTPQLRALILEELLPAGYLAFVPTKGALIPLSAADITAVSAAKDYGTRDIILTTRETEPPPLGVAHAAQATG